MFRVWLLVLAFIVCFNSEWLKKLENCSDLHRTTKINWLKLPEHLKLHSRFQYICTNPAISRCMESMKNAKEQSNRYFPFFFFSFSFLFFLGWNCRFTLSLLKHKFFYTVEIRHWWSSESIIPELRYFNFNSVSYNYAESIEFRIEIYFAD